MANTSRGIEIVGSIFGAMADPGQWGAFSCVQTNGSLEENKYYNFMRIFSGDGANATREIPFLIDDRGNIRQNNYLPFIFNDKQGKYDLDQFNPVYFSNLRTLAATANRFGMRFYFAVFDRCHGLMPHSPWRLNLQGIDGWYNPNALPYLTLWIIQVLSALKDTDFGIELENEPRDPGFTFSGPETMKILKANGVSDDVILTGLDFMPVDNPYYQSLKKELRKYGFYNKSRQFSVVHKVTEQFLEEHRHIQNHTRRFWISDDGCKPKLGQAWWEANLTRFFSYRRPFLNQAFRKRFAFEHLYRFPNDDIRGVKGISKAYYNVTGIKLWTDSD